MAINKNPGSFVFPDLRTPTTTVYENGAGGRQVYWQGQTGQWVDRRTGRPARDVQRELGLINDAPTRRVYGGSIDSTQGAARTAQQDDFNRFLALENLADRRRAQALNERKAAAYDERALRELDQKWDLGQLDRVIKEAALRGTSDYRRDRLAQDATNEAGRNTRSEAALNLRSDIAGAKQDERSNMGNQLLTSYDQAYQDAVGSYNALSSIQSQLEQIQSQADAKVRSGDFALDQNGRYVPQKTWQMGPGGLPTGLKTVTDKNLNAASNANLQVDRLQDQLARIQERHKADQNTLYDIQKAARNVGLGIQVPADAPWRRAGDVVVQPAPSTNSVDKVQVFDPNGVAGTVPRSQLNSLLSRGYTLRQ